MTKLKSIIATIDDNFYRNKGDNGIKKGAYISQSLDSRETDTVWHRFKLDCTIPPDTNLYIAYFATNQKKVIYEGREQDLDEIISSDEVDAKDKDALLAGYWQEVVANGTDFPLHKAKGRYFWYKIEYVSYGLEQPVMEDIKIDFPLTPLTNYLPEIYQENQQSYDLLNRFLGIFQALMNDLDHQINDVNSYLDLDLVNDEYLQWLCQWLDIGDYYIWPQDKLRTLLRNAYQLYQIKGTKASIERIVEIYTGEKPYIVEHFEIEAYQSKLYSRLYGDNSYTFTVMVREELLPSSQHYLELKQIIDGFKPAYTMLKLVILRPYMMLDSYVYLGINSVLSGSSNLVLNGKATIPFDTTIEEWRIVK